MARTTAVQFARQLRRLGATVTMVNGRAIARYRGVEVTIRFHRDIDAFDVAYRSDVPPEAATAIGSMAGVRRALGLPKHPVVTLGRTGRRNSLVHVLRPGWYAIAECGVGCAATRSTDRPARRPAAGAGRSGASANPSRPRLPDRFAHAEAEEQRLRAELGDVAILRERRGGVTCPLPLTELRRRQSTAS